MHRGCCLFGKNFQDFSQSLGSQGLTQRDELRANCLPITYQVPDKSHTTPHWRIWVWTPVRWSGDWHLTNAERHQLFTQISPLLLKLFSFSLSNAWERQWIDYCCSWTSLYLYSRATLGLWFLIRQLQTRTKVECKKLFVLENSGIFLFGFFFWYTRYTKAILECSKISASTEDMLAMSYWHDLRGLVGIKLLNHWQCLPTS